VPPHLREERRIFSRKLFQARPKRFLCPSIKPQTPQMNENPFFNPFLKLKIKKTPPAVLNMRKCFRGLMRDHFLIQKEIEVGSGFTEVHNVSRPFKYANVAANRKVPQNSSFFKIRALSS